MPAPRENGKGASCLYNGFPAATKFAKMTPADSGKNRTWSYLT